MNGACYVLDGSVKRISAKWYYMCQMAYLLKKLFQQNKKDIYGNGSL